MQQHFDFTPVWVSFCSKKVAASDDPDFNLGARPAPRCCHGHLSRSACQTSFGCRERGGNCYNIWRNLVRGS